MARTPLAARLQQIAADHRTTRRELLGAAGAATLGAAVWRPPVARAGAGDRVAIVGGGLAGLTCAYRLRQSGVEADVFEASDRWGGRCWSLTGYFAEGQVAERGGELIDSGHLEIKQLVQELRLTLDNLLQAEPNGTEPLYFFDGRPYTYAEAAADYNAVYQKLHRDTSEASYPTTYDVFTERGQQLDAMTITEWIEESVPDTASRFGQLLDVAYNIEFGAECSQQSALNLIYLLGYSGQGKLRLFGPSNEKFHIRGGNEQLVDRLRARLDPNRLVKGKELRAIRRTAAGYDLTFADRKTLSYPRVVLALPFSILRRSVDFSAAGFDARKTRAITELGMGTNSKLNVQFASRRWNELGCNGDTYADTGYQATWEVSRGQAGKSGILVDYTGGTIGASFGSGTLADRTKQFLSQIEPVLPEISKAYNGRSHLQYWTGHPWTRGSYSYYKPGQYTRFGGAEEEVSGACHFAGEHTTQDYQGYLNGAVFSGQRAATEVLKAL